MEHDYPPHREARGPCGSVGFARGVLPLTHVDDRCLVVPSWLGPGPGDLEHAWGLGKGKRAEAALAWLWLALASSGWQLDRLPTLARPSGPSLGTGTPTGQSQSDETQDSVFPYDRVPGGAGHAGTARWALGRSSD